MAREEENEVESAPMVHAPTRPSSSTIFAPEEQQEHRKDPLANAISEVAMSVEEYFESKKKQKKPWPTSLQIHEVVSKVHSLTKE